MTDAVSDLDLARTTAAEAGRLLVALRHDFGPVDPGDKARLKQLRDSADAASHDLIMARLVAARPGDAILSEEGADDHTRLTAARTWIVDPLDGTWEYGQHRTDFGVHIALWDADGESAALALGVVDLPALGHARTSADPDPRLPDLPVDRPLRVVCSRTRPPALLADIVQRWAARAGREVEIVNVGSVGAKVEEILAGRAEAYLHDTGFYEWDLAAPLAVAHHYGLVGSHIDGSAVQFNRMPPYVTDVMVCHPAVADHLRGALAG